MMTDGFEEMERHLAVITEKLDAWIKHHGLEPDGIPSYKINSRYEPAICVTLTVWLMNRARIDFGSIGISPVRELRSKCSSDDFDDDDIWNFVESVLDAWIPVFGTDFVHFSGSAGLSEEDLDLALKEDLLGSLLQNYLASSDRKSLASNFTPLRASRVLVSLLPRNPFWRCD